MNRLETPPGFFATVFTLGILRAIWIRDTNRQLNQGGAGFWFAWFLLAFAHYGVATRMNVALGSTGSSHRVSPLLCFWLTGFPFIGATKRLKRGVQAFNDALGVRSHAAVAAQPA